MGLVLKAMLKFQSLVPFEVGFTVENCGPGEYRHHLGTPNVTELDPEILNLALRAL